MKSISFALTLILACAWTQTAQADSCSNARPMVPMMVVVQPAEPVAPGKVELISTDLDRGPDTKGTLCISVGSLGFEVSAPGDDYTPPDKLGYLIEMLEPADDWWRFEHHLMFTDEPTPLQADEGWVWFNFDDMPEEPVDWTFRLAAVDEDGNLGEWSDPINTTHKGMDFGCATAAGGESVGMVFLIFVGLWWRRRP